jgi:hypothetical protein
VIHVIGLGFDEEQSGEVRFQLSLFLKTLQAFTFSMLSGYIGFRSNILLGKGVM